MKRRAFACVLSLLLGAGGSVHAALPEVMVVLWFDTEDYLLPASDDAALRVAEILTARGVRATFKVVGEKARVLERRGRADVIAALTKHDIGYHSNFHSVHPTPAEYLADAGWHDGVAEFVRREGPGARDVMRIFGVPGLSCYGQPGSSWAPQAVAALRQIGVGSYVDEGSQVGLDEKPFWYAGTLNVFNMGRNLARMDLHEAGGLEKGRAEFKAAYDRLRAEGGGLISIYYHPAEWVHQEFWDAVNFRRGANPPREEWKQPPPRPREETEAAYERFARYVDFQRSLPGVTYVTAADLTRIYANRIVEEGADLATVRDLAEKVARGTALEILRDANGRFVSPAEQFSLIVGFLAGAIREGRVPSRADVAGLLGPSAKPPATEVTDLPWRAFRDTLLDAWDEVRARGQVPARVFAGTKKIAPADFLRAGATVLLSVAAGSGPAAFPARVAIPTGTAVATERYVAEDTPELFGGWIIHPEGFRAPRIVEMAKLQAWTLKPAERAAAGPDLREVSLAGGKLLKDEKCMVASAAGPEQWGLRQASREFLIKKGLAASYIDEHFCVVSIAYEYDPSPGSGWVWVTYKAMFDPYVTWWQHRFPVLVGPDTRPLLRDGTAVVDVSGKVALVPEFDISEIRALLAPEDLRRRMHALIGSFVGPLDVLMGPFRMAATNDKADVRLYVTAWNKNPNSDSCGNTDRLGAIDVESGEGVVTFTGSCP